MYWIEGLDDFCLSLKELKDKIESLIEEHGEDVIICPDAGYNNVSFYLKKKAAKKKKKAAKKKKSAKNNV